MMNRIRTLALVAAAAFALAGWAAFTPLLAQGKKTEGKKNPLDVGIVNVKKIAKADFTPPAKDDKLAKVGLRATISGQVAKDEKLNVYLAVCPVGSTDAKDSLWIQKPVKRDGDKFEGECQFGEGDLGKGEIFAVVGITSSKEFGDGEQIDFDALQKSATSCSAVLFVKRKN